MENETKFSIIRKSLIDFNFDPAKIPADEVMEGDILLKNSLYLNMNLFP